MFFGSEGSATVVYGVLRVKPGQKRAKYCNPTCQRADWKNHNPTCSRPSDNIKVEYNLPPSREPMTHFYINTHLQAYAVRPLAVTPAVRLHVSHSSVLLVMVDMVPVMHNLTRRRIRIKHLLATPLAVLPPEAVQSNTDMFYRLGSEDVRKALPVPLEFFRAVFGMVLESHSLGVKRRITTDLDLLYSNLEDELAHHVENHYNMQD
ncbi:hypothetical protein C8R46DRAFT_1207274 [Mycena filopes]|nr:hypothetical protein C8R46DRAFT_1207274 [Mycena filopes]